MECMFWRLLRPLSALLGAGFCASAAFAQFYTVDAVTKELFEFDVNGNCRYAGITFPVTLNVRELAWANNRLYGICFDANGTYLVDIQLNSKTYQIIAPVTATGGLSRAKGLASSNNSLYIAYSLPATFAVCNQWGLLDPVTGVVTNIATLAYDVDGAGGTNGYFITNDFDFTNQSNTIYTGFSAPPIQFLSSYQFLPNNIGFADFEFFQGDLYGGPWDVGTAPVQGFFQKISFQASPFFPLPRVQLSRPGSYGGLGANPNPQRVFGEIVLNDIAVPQSGVTLTVEVLRASDNSVAYSRTLQTNNAGQFSFYIPQTIAPGNYVLTAKAGTWMRNRAQFSIGLGSNTTNISIALENGDVDLDGEVGPGDFELVVSQFGNPGGSADCDQDGEVGPGDFEIIVDNFGLQEN